MKALAYTSAALLLLVATGLWAFSEEAFLDRTYGSTSDGAVTRDTSPSPHPDADDLVVRRILGAYEPGGHSGWSPSPDGELVVFTDWTTGDLALRDLETGEVRRLTHEGDPSLTAHAVDARFSPDGKKVAYEWTADSETYGLRLLDVESGEVRTLVHDPENVLYVFLGSWAPDGEWIAATFSLRDGSRRVALVRVEDGHHEFLRSLDWKRPERLAFSPEGEWLAYDVPRSPDERTRDIRLLARDGSREVPLRTGPAHERVAGWLPGGGPLFFLSREKERTRLLALEVENGEATSDPRTVRSDLGDVFPLGFTRDAFHYTVTVESQEVRGAPFDPETGELAGPLETIASGGLEATARLLSWAPDGDRMIYVVTPRGAPESVRAVVRSVATGAERTVELPQTYVATADWGPDGEVVAVGRGGRTGRGVFLMELESGEMEMLLRNVQGERSYHGPRWAPDGRIVVARRDRTADPHEDAILLFDPRTGAEEELFRTEGRGAHALAPDGSRLAVARGVEGKERTSEVVVAPLPDGTPSRVAVLEGVRGIHDVEWTPDGRRLFVLASPAEGPHAIHVVAPDGSEPPRDVADVGGFSWDLRVHPDGRRIALSAGTVREEVWAMEGLRELANGEAAGDFETGEAR